MSWIPGIILSVSAFSLVALGMFPLLKVLRNRSILDRPNERSSHEIPTPKGAGLLLVPVVGVLWVLIGYLQDGVNAHIVGIATISIFLCGFSWIDDLRGLSVAPRLAVHTFCAAIGLSLLPADVLVFQGLLPPLFDHAMTLVIWVWFVNLFNFMDGIDGVSGVQSAAICAGISIVLFAANVGVIDYYYPVVLGAASVGFLLWNWHPARIFLGDAGSAPLGFMLGWLLIWLAGIGEWQAAVILPLYYLADTTITLFRRVMHGERFWQAHRQHFYQRALRNGNSHSSVVVAIVFINTGLVVCAVTASMYHSLLGLGCAVALVVSFLWYLSKFSRN